MRSYTLYFLFQIAFCHTIYFYVVSPLPLGIPGGSDGKESACDAEDSGLIPGSGRSPGEGNGNPIQYSCLENPMGRGAWQATVHGSHKELDTTKQLLFHFIKRFKEKWTFFFSGNFCFGRLHTRSL